MIKFSIITSEQPAYLTKRYCLENGELIKTSGGQMTSGSVKLISIKNMLEFAMMLPGLKHNQALCYGVPRGLNVGESKNLTTEANRTPENLSRTNKDFFWSSEPGILFIDHDTGLDKEKFLNIISKTMPELKDVVKIWYPSSSSFIYDDKKEMVGLKGQRLYFAVDKASEIPRIGKIIHQRMWLAGHGHIFVSAAGALLERSAVDATVWQPNRLDFASGALCDMPLEQKRGEPDIISGTHALLQSASIKNLSGSELKNYQDLVLSEKKRLKPEAQKKQAEHIESRLKNVPENRKKELREFYQRAYHGGILSGDFEIVVVIDGEEVAMTIEDVLNEPKKYHGCITLDPIEPEYNNYHRTGILYLAEGKQNLHSLAHGGRTFQLKRIDSTEKITNADKQIDKMFQSIEDQENGKSKPLSFPWPRITGSTQAFREKTVTVLAGAEKAGKSFLTMNIIQHIHEMGVSWSYLQLEDDVEAWGWRMLAILEKSYSMIDTSSETICDRTTAMAQRADELKGYLSNVTENPRVGCKNEKGETVIPKITPEKVLNWLRRASKKSRMVVIDPMSQIDFSGNKPWELEADFIRNCCAIVQDGKCSLILVCHTTKGSGGVGVERSSGDVQGSAMLTRLAQTTLIFDTCELEDKEIKLSGGMTKMAEANRIMLIAAARNGPGTRSKLAFLQDAKGPIFHEIGFIAPLTKKKHRKE
jgi:hypothetical protein